MSGILPSVYKLLRIKYPLLFSDFCWNLDVLYVFFKNTDISNFMKIPQLERGFSLHIFLKYSYQISWKSLNWNLDFLYIFLKILVYQISWKSLNWNVDFLYIFFKNTRIKFHENPSIVTCIFSTYFWKYSYQISWKSLNCNVDFLYIFFKILVY